MLEGMIGKVPLAMGAGMLVLSISCGNYDEGKRGSPEICAADCVSLNCDRTQPDIRDDCITRYQKVCQEKVDYGNIRCEEMCSPPNPRYSSRTGEEYPIECSYICVGG
jgi:hypothetical protein